MADYLAIAIKNYVSNYTGLPGKCWQGIVLTSINSFSIGVCFFLSLYFVDVLHISVEIAGVLISCYGVGTVVGGIVGGKLSDQLSPHSVSLFSLLTLSASFLFLLKGGSVEWLVVNMFILGVASYGFKTSNNVWVLDQCSERPDARLRVIGISHVASNFGLGLSGVLIGGLSKYGFQYIFSLSSVVLCAAAIYFIFQNDGKIAFEKKYKFESGSDSHYVQKTRVTNYKIVGSVLICLFLIGMIIAQLSTTYPIYVKEAFPNLGIKAVSMLFVLDTALIVLFQAPLTNYISEYNKMIVVGLGAFLMGFGMLVLSFSNVFFLALISCAIWTTGEMLFMTTAQLVCFENGAEKKKGQAMGVFQATYATSCVVGPIVGGIVYQHFGGNILWYLSSIVGVMCLITCIFNKN